MAKQTFSKKQLLIAVGAAVVIFLIGFYSGDAYRVNRIKSAFNSIGSLGESPDLNKDKKLVEKKLGEEIDIVKMKLTVNKSEEKNSISSKYGDAKSAKDNAKFVVVDLSVTNSTDSEFNFSPNNTLQLVDNQNRKYKTYDDSIGTVDNYLDVRELSPSIAESGVLVYEIPNDASNYSLWIDKDGSSDRFQVGLK